MDVDELRRRKNEIVARHGPWTAHPILLAEGVYTGDESADLDRRIAGEGLRLRRIVQIAADLAGKPLGQCRVLDLACLEGLHGIEFARHGAEVVALEGREDNAAKARFSAETLGLRRYSIHVDDVRNLSADRYGHFDVVLCIGILYHLDAPDVFRFIEQIGSVCRRVAIIDTHVVRHPGRKHTYRGRQFAGRHVIEHLPWVSATMRRKKLWASLDNPSALWLTRSSLHNLLNDAGFTSTYVCESPAKAGWSLGRETIVAVRGEPVVLQSIPALNDAPAVRAQEKTFALLVRDYIALRGGQFRFLSALWRSWLRRR